MPPHPALETPCGAPPDPALEARVREVLGQMTLTEKAGLLAGSDDWHIRGVPRVGISPVRVTDCGHGVTLCGDRASPATCFPTGIGMAATWNKELIEQAGVVLGRETKTLGCSLLLGPMINLHRLPINGRSFETLSEDPVLAGQLGAALIRGIQSQGVGACVKSVAANNQQKNQDHHHVEADERTVRELYLRAFEIAVRDGQPAAIMTSYNGLNGAPTSENHWLLSGVIKGEWQFPGFIVSDWRAVKTPAAISAGLDLEMPGPGRFMHSSGILSALQDSLLSPAELDDRVCRLLRFLLRYGQTEDPSAVLTPSAEMQTHRACAQAVAEESLVLLKNDGGLLPLDRRKIRRLAVLGPNAATVRLGGGGSASVTPLFTVSPLEGIRALAGADLEILHAEGVGLVGKMSVATGLQHRTLDGRLHPGVRMEIFNRTAPGSAALDRVVSQIDFSWGWASPGPGVLRSDYLARFTGVIVPNADGEIKLGLFGQEGDIRLWLGDELIIDEWDDAPGANFEAGYAVRYATAAARVVRSQPVDLKIEYRKRAARGAVRFELEGADQGGSWERALAVAGAADAVVVCAGLSNLFEGGSRDRANLDLPAAQNEFIRAVCASNPRTIVVLNNGGPLSLPWLNEVPAVIEAWYPGQEGGAALARVLFGEINPSGKLPDSFPERLDDLPAMQSYPGTATVCYHEGLQVGYRFYDTATCKPQFPFGHGLSYTSFEFDAPLLSAPELVRGDSIEVFVRVTNTGHRSGKETVQLYVRDPASSVPRPYKELKQFTKLTLAPGESRTVALPLHWDDLAFFHPDHRAWIVEPGVFEILTGPDSQALQTALLRVH